MLIYYQKEFIFIYKTTQVFMRHSSFQIYDYFSPFKLDLKEIISDGRKSLTISNWFRDKNVYMMKLKSTTKFVMHLSHDFRHIFCYELIIVNSIFYAKIFCEEFLINYHEFLPSLIFIFFLVVNELLNIPHTIISFLIFFLQWVTAPYCFMS